MLHRVLACSVLLVACTGDDGPLTSESTEPTRDFEVEPPEVDTDWPMDTDPPVPMDPVPFAGDWVDNYGSAHTITDEDWDQTYGLYAFVEVDADTLVIIAENDAGNDFNAGKFSRFDWVEVDGSTWFCQTAFDADTADDARAVPRSDDSDPATSGCGGTFPWSQLLEPLPIRGEWVDNWSSEHAISETRWSTGDSIFNVSDYDTQNGWIVAQNGAENAFNPDLWSRFEWTTVGEQLYYCQVAFDAATRDDALAAGPADASDPATTGCGTFAWSELNPKE